MGMLSCWFVELLSCYGAYPANLAGVPDALTFFSPPFLPSRKEKEGGSPKKKRRGATSEKSLINDSPRQRPYTYYI